MLRRFFYAEEHGRERRAIPAQILKGGNDPQNPAPRLADYPNVSGLIGTIVSHKLATLHELQTIYSYDDALDMYEMIVVNNYNERQILKTQKPRGR